MKVISMVASLIIRKNPMQNLTILEYWKSQLVITTIISGDPFT